MTSSGRSGSRGGTGAAKPDPLLPEPESTKGPSLDEGPFVFRVPALSSTPF